jgi:hypothetical protein
MTRQKETALRLRTEEDYLVILQEGQEEPFSYSDNFICLIALMAKGLAEIDTSKPRSKWTHYEQEVWMRLTPKGLETLCPPSDPVAACANGWRPIDSAPPDFTEILVGWWSYPDPEEPESYVHERGGQLVDPAIDLTKPRWMIAISSYEDYGFRRGFRHRNGAWQATHWMPQPGPATPVPLPSRY